MAGPAEDVDVRRWAVLHLIRELGSLAAVGRTMQVSTSAVSQQVLRLESETGAALVHRDPAGARLTEAGAVLADAWPGIEGEIRSARARLRAITADDVRRIHLMSVPTATATVLPLVVAELREAAPRLQLNLESATVLAAYRAVDAHGVDGALLWHYRDEPPRLRSRPDLRRAFVDRMVLIASVGHPLAGSSRVRFADVLDSPFVGRRADERGDTVLRRAAATVGKELRIDVTAADTAEQQGLVAAGMGVAMIQELALITLRDDVCVLPVLDSLLPTRLFDTAWPSHPVTRADRELVTGAISAAAGRIYREIGPRLPAQLRRDPGGRGGSRPG